MTPTCAKCGQATYCGGPQCPSSSLVVAPDGVPMIQEAYVSVAVFWPGISLGVLGPAAG